MVSGGAVLPRPHNVLLCDFLNYGVVRGGRIMSKELTPQEALIALAEGKRIHIRRKGLPEDAYIGYIYMADGVILNECGHVEHIASLRNYHIYEEPRRKKVKMWQWVYKTGNKRPRQTRTYFLSEQDAMNAVFPGKLIKKLDYTEIEVEE